MTDKKTKHTFDSRKSFAVTSFNEETQILVMKNSYIEKQYNLQNAKDREELIKFLYKSINIMEKHPEITYPGYHLISHGLKLAHVILTEESSQAFIFTSAYLLQQNYIKELHDKKFRKQDIPISSRNLNDWIHTQKLLPDDRTNTEQWHTFSKIDIAYIYVLKACREFGISLRFLHNAKESLLTRIPQSKFCLLEIAYTCFDKSKESGDIFLYMDSTGHCNIARIDDIVLMAKEKMINKNFILNLSEVWREI